MAPTTTDHDGLVGLLCQALLDDPSEPTTVASSHLHQLAPLLPADTHSTVVRLALAEIAGLGRLQELLDDPEIDEVMVNGGGEIWVERSGGLHPVGRVATPRVEALIERILAPLGRRLDRSSPVVDARLPDGSRLCAVVPPVSVDGPCLCIRRFRLHPVPLGAFAPPEVEQVLAELVARRCNVVVAGATSAGKTTLLNALTGLVPPGTRIVTLEDTAELRLTSDHVVRLEARPASADGPPPIELRELLRAALRLRPDRLVVGEVRGAEALDLLQALNTGHDGSLATVHANSPIDTVRRLAAMVAQGGDVPVDFVHDLIHSAIDVVIQVARQPHGTRTVCDVVELARPDSDTPHDRALVRDGQVVAPLTRSRVP
jgi:pilus assembly protein CpaF